MSDLIEKALLDAEKNIQSSARFVFYLLSKADSDIIYARIEESMDLSVKDIDEVGIEELGLVCAYAVTLCDENGDRSDFLRENSFHYFFIQELKKLNVGQTNTGVNLNGRRV